MEITSFQEYGIIGGIIVALFFLVRQLMIWMQGRIDAKDKVIDERHVQLVQLTMNTLDYVNDSKQVNRAMLQQIEALTDKIEQMGNGICEKLERFEMGR